MALKHFIAGFSNELIASRQQWGQILTRCSVSSLPPAPKKEFKPKMGLPKLKSYKDCKPGPEYWSRWPKNSCRVGKSRIDGHKLKNLAVETGFKDKEILEKVFVDLTMGAKIGCRGQVFCS